jgi:hypothetical protein
VTLDAVSEVEPEQRQDDVVEVDPQTTADVAADVAGAELVWQEVAIRWSPVEEPDVAGVVKPERAEREESPLEQRDRVLDAGDGRR